MAIYLIRHASAGTRNPSDDNDSKRTLDSRGIGQADLLADWLGSEPVQRIVSSPFIRCTQTVAPLARKLGVAVEVDDRLSEASPVEPAWKALVEFSEEAGPTGADVAVCSHGDLIPDLIRRAQLRGMRVRGKSGCSKGSVWRLGDWDGVGFASGTYTAIHP